MNSLTTILQSIDLTNTPRGHPTIYIYIYIYTHTHTYVCVCVHKGWKENEIYLGDKSKSLFYIYKQLLNK